jgi:hypothetical protein
MPFEWNTKTIASIAIAALLILSVLGFSIGTGQQDGGSVTYRHGKYKFQQTAQGYVVKLPEGRTTFRFLPDQVAAYGIPAEAVPLLRSATVLSFTLDPANETDPFTQAMGSVAFLDLPQKLGQRTLVQPGLTNATGVEVPAITCASASPVGPVVLFARGNATGFRWENSCLIAEAVDEDGILRLSDRIAYAVLGIME